MKTFDFICRNDNFRRKLYTKTIRIPTEVQLNTWENEGGCLYGVKDNNVIINGLLCETFLDRIRATVKPYWDQLRAMFRKYKYR